MVKFGMSLALELKVPTPLPAMIPKGAVMKSSDHLVAADIMQRPVVCAEPHELLSVLEDRMFNARITGLPVLEQGRLVGIVSRSDIIRYPRVLNACVDYASERWQWIGTTPTIAGERTAAEPTPDTRSSPGQLTVGDVMVTEIVTCAPQSSVSKVADEMIRHHVHRVIVVEDDRPVGIVSSLDIVELLTESRGNAGTEQRTHQN